MIEPGEFEALVREQVPLVGGFKLRVDAIGDGSITVFMPYRDDFIRPGGTITGFIEQDFANLAAFLDRDAGTTDVNSNGLDSGDVDSNGLAAWRPAEILPARRPRRA